MSREAQVKLSIAGGDMLPVFHALVQEEYGKRGWMDPNQTVGDKFDVGAQVVVVQDGEEIIAGMRIVKDVGCGFPHEDIMDLDGLREQKLDTLREVCERLSQIDRGEMAEITKLVGKKRSRNLTIDLAKCIYWFAKSQKVRAYLMVIDMEFFILCDKRGIPIRPIGTPQICEGSWTIPAVIFPEEFEISVPQKNAESWEYISRPTNTEGLVRH